MILFKNIFSPTNVVNNYKCDNKTKKHFFEMYDTPIQPAFFCPTLRKNVNDTSLNGVKLYRHDQRMIFFAFFFSTKRWLITTYTTWLITTIMCQNHTAHCLWVSNIYIILMTAVPYQRIVPPQLLHHQHAGMGQ